MWVIARALLMYGRAPSKDKIFVVLLVSILVINDFVDKLVESWIQFFFSLRKKSVILIYTYVL